MRKQPIKTRIMDRCFKSKSTEGLWSTRARGWHPPRDLENVIKEQLGPGLSVIKESLKYVRLFVYLMGKCIAYFGILINLFKFIKVG